MDKPGYHIPVMPAEVLGALNIMPDGKYLDGTLGSAGHSVLIAARLDGRGTLYGIDRDGQAIEAAAQKIEPFKTRVHLIRDNFFNAKALLDGVRLDGALLDLGVSSRQFDEPARGFSYRFDARLDMRMDDRDTLTAYDIINEYSEEKLTQIFFNYGEERFSKRIVRAIAEARKLKPIETTGQLSDIIAAAVPKFASAGHPAKKVFQALRMEVNGELEGLDAALRDITELLKPGGRFCVITFHSLEDRAVKQCFTHLANPCTCPRDIPYCVCGQTPSVKIITRKPVLPTEQERADNPRPHSAKLRVAEKV